MDLTIPIANSNCNINWNTAIIDYCKGWRNLSTYSHNLYIKIFWLIVFFSLLEFKFPIRIHKEFGHIKAIRIFIDIQLFDFLRKISMGVLLFRIFQVYYISKLYLGGV